VEQLWLEEHVEEVRMRNEELSRLLTERPFDTPGVGRRLP